MTHCKSAQRRNDRVVSRFPSRNNNMAQGRVPPDPAPVVRATAPSLRLSASVERLMCQPHGIVAGHRAVTEFESAYRIAWESSLFS